jgi:hypothetical protein
MMKHRFLVCFSFISLFVSSLFSTHTVNRYFPFLEKPEDYITQKRTYFSPALFLTTASNAFRRSDGGRISIPALHGNYDLKNLIESLQSVKQDTTYNPFDDEPGYVDWNAKSAKFVVTGKIKSRGIILANQFNLFKSDFSLGFFLPIMHVNTSQRFSFNAGESDTVLQSITTSEVELLDRVRREVHNEMNLAGDAWSKTGLGDLDLQLRFNHEWDHKFKMRTISLALQTGVLFPTGSTLDYDYACAVPFMGNKHWGAYIDAVTELELKQNWKLGFMFGFADSFNRTSRQRIAVNEEPNPFSALIGDVKINPGSIFKFSPYFTLENLSDGLHFHMRYGYVRHGYDKWVDKRSDQTVSSYLERGETNKDTKRNLTKWVMHYISLQLRYDSTEALKNWWLKPNFYMTYDHPFKARGSSKTHQLTLGLELNW